MATWSIATAKSKLSEIIERAGDEPQIITNRGKPVAVLTTIEGSEVEMPKITGEIFVKSLKKLRGKLAKEGINIPSRKGDKLRNPFEE